MTTKIEKTIQVDVPVRTAYNQWTQFEEFPQFMGGVDKVTQLDDKTLQWEAQIAGVKRKWEAKILEQVPDSKVAWAATSGATNAGAVYFTPIGPAQTSVTLHLEYAPEGLIENLGDKLHIVEKQATADLEKFKAYIESNGAATGAWRGTVDGVAGIPGVEDAATSEGDKGKNGISKTAVLGAAAAAAGVAAASKLKGGSSGEYDESYDGADGETVAVAEITTVTTSSEPYPAADPIDSPVLAEDAESRSMY